jgi:WD40 repeat protein
MDKQAQRTLPDAALAAFSRDGKRLTFVDGLRLRSSGSVWASVWEVDTGKELGNLDAPAEIDIPKALSRDGRFVLGISVGKGQVLWDLTLNKVQLAWKDSLISNRTAVQFSPAGDILAVCNGTTVHIIDPTTGKKRNSFSHEPGSSDRDQSLRVEMARPMLAFSPDGSRAAVGEGTNTVYVWNLVGERQVGPFVGHRGPVTAVAPAPGGHVAITLGVDGTIRQWETPSGREVGQRSLPNSRVDGALTPDGRLVGSLVRLDSIRVLEVATGREIRRVEGEHLRDIFWSDHLTLTPDGQTLVARTREGATYFVDVATNKVRFRTDNEGKGERLSTTYLDRSPIAFSMDSRLVAIVDLAEKSKQEANLDARSLENLWSAIRLLDVTTGRVIRRFDKQTGEISGLAFSPDGRSVAAINEGNTLFFWEVATGKKRLQINGKLPKWESSLQCMAFTPDGRHLVTGGDDAIIRLWDLATGQEVGQLAGHDAAVLSLAFTPDGKLLLSASADSTGLVWQVPTLPGATTKLEAAQMEQFWADLKAEDAAKAYQAVCALSADPTRSVPFLRKELQPASPPDAKRIAQLIADLDGNQFEAREKANQELEKLGKAAEQVLRQALTGDLSLEARRRVEHVLARPEAPLSTPEDIRLVRAVEVLARIGSPEAKEVLRSLAKGAAGHWLTRDAASTLEWLDRTVPAKP